MPGLSSLVDLDDPDRIAARAGVVRLPEDAPGHRRVRRGRGFSYHAPDRTLLDGDERARIETMAIPPAWSEVWIAPDPDSHILATGLDEAGRKQYLYHPAWREAADAVKFERLGRFAPALVRLRRRVERDIAGPLDAEPTQAALVTRLLDRSLIRVGTRCYAEVNGSYGATTLLAGHVMIEGSTVRLVFTAKGGHEREVEADDALLARRLGALVEHLGADEPVFHDDDGRPISRTTVNRYIATHSGGAFTSKDFRTWGASCVVTRSLADVVPGGEAPEDRVRSAIVAAAEALGNTPDVCRASYVAPAVVSAYLDKTLPAVWRRSRGSRWLERDERTCGRILAAAAP